MKITIIYDNTTVNEELHPDWGFAALIEYQQKKILFDTGANGEILLANMEKLGINPEIIADVVISHAHFDHTGGPSAFLNKNNRVKVWCPPTFRGVKNAREVIDVSVPTKLYDGLYSTGELEGIEQSLCCETSQGLVIIVGCSHPRMNHILEVAAQFGRVYALIGGMHGTRPELLEGVDLICPTHCTMHKEKMKSLYSAKYIEGGAGCRIEIE